jgi:hypothetical protein
MNPAALSALSVTLCFRVNHTKINSWCRLLETEMIKRCLCLKLLFWILFNIKFTETIISSVLSRLGKKSHQIAKPTSPALNIDSMLSRKGHVEWLMFKLGSVCFAVRAIKPYMSQETIRIIYFSHFYSFVTCGIIFWGSSPHIIHIFGLIRIITNSRSRDSCRELFRKQTILPLQS